jgi:hypothetical protein
MLGEAEDAKVDVGLGDEGLNLWIRFDFLQS